MNRTQKAEALKARRREEMKQSLLKIALRDESRTPFEINPQKARECAKELFLLGENISEIAKLVGVERMAISHRAAEENWEEQRAHYQSEIFKSVLRSNQDKISSILKNSLTLIDRGIKKQLQDPSYAPSPRALKDLTGVLNDVNKFFRDAQGLSMEVTAKIELTHEKVLDLIQQMQAANPNIDYGVVLPKENVDDSPTTH